MKTWQKILMGLGVLFVVVIAALIYFGSVVS